jgi:hypothetical protein
MIHDALTLGKVRVPDAAHDLPRDWTLAHDVGHALAGLLAASKLNHDVYHATSGETLTLRAVADLLKTWWPDLVVEIDSNLRRAPRGVHIGRYLQTDTGFDSWTPFADGLRTILMKQREYFGVTT